MIHDIHLHGHDFKNSNSKHVRIKGDSILILEYFYTFSSRSRFYQPSCYPYNILATAYNILPKAYNILPTIYCQYIAILLQYIGALDNKLLQYLGPQQ